MGFMSGKLDFGDVHDITGNSHAGSSNPVRLPLITLSVSNTSNSQNIYFNKEARERYHLSRFKSVKIGLLNGGRYLTFSFYKKDAVPGFKPLYLNRNSALQISSNCIAQEIMSTTDLVNLIGFKYRFELQDNEVQNENEFFIDLAKPYSKEKKKQI